MTGMLLSKGFVATYGKLLDETARDAGLKPDIVHLPDDPQAQLAPSDRDRIEVTMLGHAGRDRYTAQRRRVCRQRVAQRAHISREPRALGAPGAFAESAAGVKIQYNHEHQRAP